MNSLEQSMDSFPGRAGRCRSPGIGRSSAGIWITHRKRSSFWAAELARRFAGRPIAVALEQSRGSLVFMLTKYAHLVLFPVHPTTLSDYRKGFRPSGAKSDRPTGAPSGKIAPPQSGYGADAQSAVLGGSTPYHQPGRTLIELEGPHCAADPVCQLFVAGGLSVGVGTGSQHCDEQMRLLHGTTARVVDRDGGSRPSEGRF